MHIGFLQAYFSRERVGGGELHTERLARALIDRGHRVTIYTDAPNSRRGGITDLEVKEYETPAKLNPVNELVLAQRAMGDMQASDVVILTDTSAWRGVDISVPTIVVYHIVWHGWVHRQGSWLRALYSKPQALLYRRMERKICDRTDAIVAISPNIREDIERIGDYSEKLCDIPNGVDITRFKPQSDKYEEFTVHFQGRLIPMKNPNLMIEALHYADTDWRLTIGGAGPLREALEDRAEELGVAESVEFLGFVPDDELPARYARSHVYALPSNYEGMPLTVLEAAASGTALVVSERAATDFVTNETGITVNPVASDIAAAVDQLAQDPESAISMGKRARQKAEDYSWEEIAGRYERLFESIE